MTNEIMRVSIRFHKVCNAIAQKFRVSLPVATEMILDNFAKGGMIIFNDTAVMINIIKQVTNEIRNEKKKSDLFKPEQQSSNQAVTESNSQEKKEIVL